MNALLRTIIASVLLAAGAHAGAADTITIIVSSIEKQIYLPAKLAEELGYLKETGLEIVLLSEPAGSSAEKEMLSGIAQGVIGFYDHTILLQARGKLAECVVQFGQAPGEVLLVAKAAVGSIKSPADLRNKTLGVTGLGSSTHLLTQYLAAKAGVRNSEFAIIPVGAGSRFIAAMAEGKIDAGMTTEPTVSRLLAADLASILVDLRTVGSTEAVLGGSYPGACLYMPTAWINRHKEEVQKVVSAFVRALAYIATHSAAQIADKLPPEYYAADKQMYVAALETGKLAFTADGRMPDNGPATVLRLLNAFDKSVRGKPINLDNTYTNDFVNAARP